MADNIRQINSNKTAIPGKLYYDKNGDAYLGLPTKRLEKLRSSSISTNNTIIDNDLNSKTIFYDGDDNVILIQELNGGKIVLSKQFKYDSSGNILSISISGYKNYTKNFTYDSNGNVKTINIK